MKTEIKILKKVKMKKPILIEGLPGIGFVGKMAAEVLIEELDGKKVAEICSPYFPHHVLMSEDGIVKTMKNELYHIQRKDKENDLLVLIGETQAANSKGQYIINEKIIEYLKTNGGEEVITIGGYRTGDVTHKPKVFGAATNKKVVKKYKKKGIKFGETKGAIIGAAGILLAIARMYKMEGICIMGETHGGYIDAKSAKTVLKKLAEILEIKLNMKKLDKKAKENEELLEKLESAIKKEKQQKEDEIAPGGLTYIR